MKESTQIVLNQKLAWCCHLFVFEDWLFPTKSCDFTSSNIKDLYLEGFVSMTMFSMPGGNWGPVNLAGLVAASHDMVEGEGLISEQKVSLIRVGVGE